MLYGGLTRILTQKESQKAIHSCLYNKCHKTLSSFIFHSPNQNLDDFIGSIHVELNLYKDVFIRLQIEITEYAELKVFFISLLTLMSNLIFKFQNSICRAVTHRRSSRVDFNHDLVCRILKIVVCLSKVQIF